MPTRLDGLSRFTLPQILGQSHSVDNIVQAIGLLYSGLAWHRLRWKAGTPAAVGRDDLSGSERATKPCPEEREGYTAILNVHLLVVRPASGYLNETCLRPVSWPASVSSGP